MPLMSALLVGPQQTATTYPYHTCQPPPGQAWSTAQPAPSHPTTALRAQPPHPTPPPAASPCAVPPATPHPCVCVCLSSISSTVPPASRHPPPNVCVCGVCVVRVRAGDRPTVIEMLHHPWIQMFQRRASVRTPAVMGPFAHRSSAGGQDPSSPGGSGQGGHHHSPAHGLHGPSPLNPRPGSPRTLALAQQQQAQALAYQQQAQAQRLQRVG